MMPTGSTSWSADVVKVYPRSVSGLALPPCLLSLGRADGMGVYVDGTEDHARTLRLPSSAVAMQVLVDADTMRPPPDGLRECDL